MYLTYARPYARCLICVSYLCLDITYKSEKTKAQRSWELTEGLQLVRDATGIWAPIYVAPTKDTSHALLTGQSLSMSVVQYIY